MLHTQQIQSLALHIGLSCSNRGMQQRSMPLYYYSVYAKSRLGSVAVPMYGNYTASARAASIWRLSRMTPSDFSSSVGCKLASATTMYLTLFAVHKRADVALRSPLLFLLYTADLVGLIGHNTTLTTLRSTASLVRQILHNDKVGGLRRIMDVVKSAAI